MASRPIWSTEALVERANDPSRVRPRVWAIEELSERAPERLLELAPDLLAAEPAVAEATAIRLAPKISVEDATALIAGVEPSVHNFSLFLRAGNPEGAKIARRFRTFAPWIELHRESFVDWFQNAPVAVEPDLASALAHNLVSEGAEWIAQAILKADDLQVADQVGAHLHLAATGMLGAFAANAGARGVSALRSPHFNVPDAVSSGFNEVGNLPPTLPRKRFEPALRKIWGELFEVHSEVSRQTLEVLRDVSTAAIELPGKPVSEAAVHLARRALAAGILVVGVDNAFAAEGADPVEVWVSFSAAGFSRADERLFEQVEDRVEAARRCIELVEPEGLSAAIQLAFHALGLSESPHEGATQLAQALEPKIDESALFRLAESEGYRECLAIAPAAFRAMAEAGLKHQTPHVHAETIRGLEASGDRAASELLREHFDELLRYDATQWGVRGLAILADPDTFELVRDAWRPGEPKLASFVLAMGEICGADVPAEIVEEGEAAFRTEAQMEGIQSQDVELTLQQLREQFTMMLQCDACGRFGRYDTPFAVVDPRAIQQDHIEGPVLPSSEVTCKYCGAAEKYRVESESNFYLVPQLIASRGGDENARVEIARLEHPDGTLYRSASHAVEHAREAASDAETYIELLRVMNLFAPDEAAGVEEHLRENFGAEFEAWQRRDPNAASWQKVTDALAEGMKSLDRRKRQAKSKAMKVGRYGVAKCYRSTHPSTTVVAVALVRKMPRGKLALGWAAADTAEAKVATASVHFGLVKEQVERMIEGWNGAPFEPCTPAQASELLVTELERAVGRGNLPSQEFVMNWPYFESIVER